MGVDTWESRTRNLEDLEEKGLEEYIKDFWKILMNGKFSIISHGKGKSTEEYLVRYSSKVTKNLLMSY